MSRHGFNSYGSSFSSGASQAPFSRWNGNRRSRGYNGSPSSFGANGFTPPAPGGWRRGGGGSKAALCAAIALALVLVLAAVSLGVHVFGAKNRLLRAEKRTVRELLSWVEDNTGTVGTADGLLDTLYHDNVRATVRGRIGGLGAVVKCDLSRGWKVLSGAAVVSGGEDTGGVGFEFAANRRVLQFSVPGDSYDVYGLKYREVNGFLKKLSAAGNLRGLDGLKSYRFNADFFGRKRMSLERAVSGWTEKLLDGCRLQRLDKRPLTIDGESRLCAVYAVQSKGGSLLNLFQGNPLQKLTALSRQLSPSFRCYVDGSGRLVGIDCTFLGVPYEVYLEGSDNPWSRIRVLRDGAPLYTGGTESGTRQSALYLRDGDGEVLRLTFDRVGGGFGVRTRGAGELLRGSLTERDGVLRLEAELNLPGAPAIELSVSKLAEKPAMLARQYRRAAELNSSDCLRILRASGLQSLDETVAQAEEAYR